jgi:hypothetical protein
MAEYIDGLWQADIAVQATVDHHEYPEDRL